jgi:alpha-tubulin suppressor-like RCC1 family protein
MRMIRLLPIPPIVAALACGEDVQAPTAPESNAPAAAVAAAVAPLSFRQISAGGSFSCGVTVGDRAYCWGRNDDGQLGDGSTAFRTVPVAVAGGLRFKHVSTGGTHTCGVTLDDRAFCWGWNGDGQLGDGTRDDRLTPGAVAGGRKFRQIRAGSVHTCAITPSNVAFCWGSNAYGQLGVGSIDNGRLTPVRVQGGQDWLQLTAGAGHSCGVTTANKAYCWGNSAFGELGDGSQNVTRPAPVAVAGGLLFRQIEAGTLHTCGVTSSDNRAYCWGSNINGQLGDGTRTDRLTPTAVAGSRRFDHLNAAQTHTCGVTLTSRGFCWGDNRQAQLGDGTFTSRLKPVPLGVALALTQVTAGNTHSCAVTTGNKAYCWGDNAYGQLGEGTVGTHVLPVLVSGQ